MRGELYFRVLGPVVVERAGEPVAVGGPQRKAVLSVLLLHANRVVSIDRLADELWGDSPPLSFRVQLQGAVSKIREVLGGNDRRSAAPIDTQAPGYRLCLSPNQLDADEFRRDVAAARDKIQADDPATAAELLRTALARWRGPAFDGVSYPALQHAAAELEEIRLGALEDRIEADIALGHHQEVIAELGSLIRDHPLRERFYGQLMMSLARVGRLADALSAYRDLRGRMVEELGVEPSTQLQQLHRAILTGATGAQPADPVPYRSYVVPRQLPGDVPDLIGREELLDAAADLLSGGHAPTIPACLAVTGPGGVGKTAFALRLAHRVRERFPDGQLYARLGGSGPGRLAPGVVLSRFLHALGIPPGGVPTALDERSSLFRELLVTRRTLIILDDADNETQVRPLLPAEPRCAILITSRRRLSGVERMQSMPLEVLPSAAGVDLLRKIVGISRIDAEPRAAAQIVQQCGGLPLAIRIVAARLASRVNWTVADMARRVTVDRDRLDWLQLGDLGIRTSLAQTYSALGESQQRLFRRLGLLHASEFPGWLPAALLDRRHGATERLLDDLIDVHLVEPAGRGVTGPRYRMHDLIHLLAGELATEEEAPATRRAALGRALNGWLDLAATADAQIPHWYGLDPEPPPTWRAPQEAKDAVRADPFTWFDEEYDVLAGSVQQASDQGYAQVAWPLAQRLTTYLELHGRYDEWADVLAQGLRAAERGGDQRGIACMLGLLIDAESDRDRISISARYAEQAVAAYSALPDEPEEPVHDLAVPCRRELQPELTDLEAELTRARHAGDPLDIALGAFRLILARRHAGEHGGYQPLWEEMRNACRACGARVAELGAIKILGLTYIKQRRLDEAIECLVRGQSIIQNLGDDVRLADVLGDIALAFAAHGRFAEAEHLTRDSLEQARNHRHRWDEGRALDTLGALKRNQGDHRAALNMHLEAFTVWRRIDQSGRMANTIKALAELCDDLGDTHAAAIYREQFAEVAEQISMK
jgi:DNA-binding SARP family transcriptional activator/tetratricopeptide (TPR) repeat protein